MSFRELAIEAHHEEEKAVSLWRQKQADKFARQAIAMFHRHISDVAVTATAIDPKWALLKADDVTIKAYAECGSISFFVDATCSRCEWTSPLPTPTLADIGKALEGLSECSHCDI